MDRISLEWLTEKKWRWIKLNSHKSQFVGNYFSNRYKHSIMKEQYSFFLFFFLVLQRAVDQTKEFVYSISQQYEKKFLNKIEPNDCAPANRSKDDRRKSLESQFSLDRCVENIMLTLHETMSFDWIANFLHKRLEEERLSMLMSTT